MHKRMYRRRLWLTPLLTLLVVGCNQQDPERLARIGRKSMARCEELTSGLRDKVASGLDAVRATWPAEQQRGPRPANSPSLPPSTPAASVSSTPLDARVLWRIRWDKALAGADIQVQSPSGGIVEIRGIVNDLARQRRAIELAETTEGVDRVVNEMGLKQP